MHDNLPAPCSTEHVAPNVLKPTCMTNDTFPGSFSCSIPQALPTTASTDNSRHPHMVPPVASKQTNEMLSRSTLAATTLSGPLILQAEFVVKTKFALVSSAARVQRLPGQVVAALNKWTKVPCLAWNSGVNNTQRTCIHTLSLSHDYVICLFALRLNIASLFNS